MMLLLRKLSEIDMVVIHCADTPNGYLKYTAKHIDGWHKKRGFKRCVNRGEYRHIGYHYVINTDGTTEVGRGLDEIGAHASPYNARSVGICMVGLDRFTAEQWDSLRVVVDNLFSVLPGLKRIVGHRDLVYRRVCPGFDVNTWFYDKGMIPLPGQICEQRTKI